VRKGEEEQSEVIEDCFKVYLLLTSKPPLNPVNPFSVTLSPRSSKNSSKSRLPDTGRRKKERKLEYNGRKSAVKKAEEKKERYRSQIYRPPLSVYLLHIIHLL
jgi:hypothetical protein